ncbi:glycosyltransferase [Flavobacterium sp. 3HN19-14]|uniref:glycosyltransferase n=1 Tax=Flavobacterium sp. 3HN19-14 TaxID=3448133 RepID=UPI003EE0AD96
MKTNAVVYTYFHQKLFLEIPKTFSFKQKLTFQIKSLIFKFLLKNTDYLMVQTQVVKDDFSAKINVLKPENILLLPFYPQINSTITGKIDRKKHSFVYISSGSPHKNHKRLLTAFVDFYNLHKTGELRLTVSEDYLDLLMEVQDLQRKGYPIVNYGFMEREALAAIYSSSEYCIYPSLSESFGLGIIEAVESGCKIIGADLPYTNAVCKPSITFNPLDEKSITEAFEKAINNEDAATEQKVFNEIDKLIAILKTGTC